MHFWVSQIYFNFVLENFSHNIYVKIQHKMYGTIFFLYTVPYCSCHLHCSMRSTYWDSLSCFVLGDWIIAVLIRGYWYYQLPQFLTIITLVLVG